MEKRGGQTSGRGKRGGETSGRGKRGGQTSGRGNRGEGPGIRKSGRLNRNVRYLRKTRTPALKLSAAAAARFKELTTAPKEEPRMAVRNRKQPRPLQNIQHQTQGVNSDGWAK